MGPDDGTLGWVAKTPEKMSFCTGSDMKLRSKVIVQ